MIWEKIGITRFIPSIVDESSAIKDGNLTDEEKDNLQF